jgi:hypothetical protein
MQLKALEHYSEGFIARLFRVLMKRGSCYAVLIAHVRLANHEKSKPLFRERLSVPAAAVEVDPLFIFHDFTLSHCFLAWIREGL